MARWQSSESNGVASFGAGLVMGMALGAGVMYVFDPRAGQRRRALARDQASRLGGRVDEVVSESVFRKVDHLSGVARAARHQMSVGSRPRDLPDQDQFITDRVQSIVFRDPSIPKGDINVNTVEQVVYLHGTVHDPAMVAEIERRVRDVEGVRDVVNVINRPNVDPSAVRANQVRQEEPGT